MDGRKQWRYQLSKYMLKKLKNYKNELNEKFSITNLNNKKNIYTLHYLLSNILQLCKSIIRY